MSIINFYNTVVRLGSLFIKYIMTYYLAYKLPPESYGEFTLTQTVFSYTLYAAGMDFYLFSNRYILKHAHNSFKSSSIFFVQLYANIIGLFVMSIPFYFYMNSSGFGIKLIVVMLISVLADCLAQEVTRILEILGDQRCVSEINAIRFGLGSLIIIVISYYGFIGQIYPSLDLVNLYCVLIFCSSLSFAYGLMAIKSQINLTFVTRKMHLLKAGMIKVPMYIAGTLSYRGLLSFDKLIIGYFCSKSVLSWYGFICLTLAGIQLVQDTIISAYFYPKIMRHGIRNEHNEMYVQAKKMAGLNAILGVVLGFVSVLLFYVARDYMPIARYAIDNIVVFILLIVCHLINSISTPYHYILYSKNMTNKISIMYVITLFMFLFLSIVSSTYAISPLGISISLTISFVFLSILRFKLTKEEMYA